MPDDADAGLPWCRLICLSAVSRLSVAVFMLLIVEPEPQRRGAAAQPTRQPGGVSFFVWTAEKVSANSPLTFRGISLAKYLVTGAAGFIGRSIAAALLARGESVRGIDSFITGKRANLAGLEAMEFVEGDLTDPAACAKACDGVEIVFHEAALASVPRSVADPVGTNANCVDATLNLLVAARAAGVRRVIYAGSSSAYGDTPTLPKHEQMLPAPISPYAVAKLAGEHYMGAFTRVYGLETVVLRYFNVFGPHQDPHPTTPVCWPSFAAEC
jgi:nucleoside-diphosphate-sugar epimerase